MSALCLRRRPSRAKCCDWFGCDPHNRTVAQRRKAMFDVLLFGRPAGMVCREHAVDLREVWVGAHDRQPGAAA